jgi:uncharacterized integral membrane protein
MSKLKAVLLIILAAVLVDFAVENGAPIPDLKLFKFALGQIPTFLLAYLALALGLIGGWTIHVLRVRKRRRKAAAAAALASLKEE